VHSDIAKAIDEASMTALIILDLSATFVFWNQGTGFNLGKVVLQRLNSVCFSDGYNITRVFFLVYQWDPF